MKYRAAQASEPEYRTAKPAEAPRATYTTQKGKSINIDTNDREVAYLRGQLDQARWQSRQTRVDSFYGRWYGQPVVVYDDHYHPYLNYWLLSLTLEQQISWVHHHRDRLDDARYDALCAQNAQLKARVAALEKEPRDPTWKPEGVEADMLVNDGYAEALFNPVVAVQEPQTVEEGGGLGSVCWIMSILLLIVVVVLVGIAIYNRRPGDQL